MGHTPHTRIYAPNRIGPGRAWARVACYHELRPRMHLRSRSTTCGHECISVQGVLRHATFWIFFSDFGIQSQFWNFGEATLSTGTQNDFRLFGDTKWSSSTWTRCDLKTFLSTWSRSDPEHLNSESSPSTWTRSHHELHLTLSEVLHNYCFDL